MLEQRIDGLTIEDVVQDLLAYGNGGSVPDMNRWLWRASGLLQLHPELAEKLIAPYAKLQLNGRGLTLDLLAAGGNAPCQAVMRTLLTNRNVGTSDEYGQLLQRVSLLESPVPETAALVWKSYQDGRAAHDRDLRYAAAFAIGSTAHHLDDPDLAQRYNRQLGDELRNARDAEERAMLLRALGNAGMNENVPMLAAAAQDDDADVRRAAAVGLRLTDTPESTAALIALAGDPNPSVQSSALAALDKHALSPAELTTLAELVLRGATAELNDQTLIALLAAPPRRRRAGHADAPVHRRPFQRYPRARPHRRRPQLTDAVGGAAGGGAGTEGSCSAGDVDRVHAVVGRRRTGDVRRAWLALDGVVGLPACRSPVKVTLRITHRRRIVEHPPVVVGVERHVLVVRRALVDHARDGERALDRACGHLRRDVGAVRGGVEPGEAVVHVLLRRVEGRKDLNTPMTS